MCRRATLQFLDRAETCASSVNVANACFQPCSANIHNCFELPSEQLELLTIAGFCFLEVPGGQVVNLASSSRAAEHTLVTHKMPNQPVAISLAMH